jgi:endogenous inhibitor of DNA gyrase (YacG/DUF329 family)
MCGKPAPRRPANRSHPFCSDRCRLLDLGNWLDENYRIPEAEKKGTGYFNSTDSEEDA